MDKWLKIFKKEGTLDEIDEWMSKTFKRFHSDKRDKYIYKEIISCNILSNPFPNDKYIILILAYRE